MDGPTFIAVTALEFSVILVLSSCHELSSEWLFLVVVQVCDDVDWDGVGGRDDEDSVRHLLHEWDSGPRRGGDPVAVGEAADGGRGRVQAAGAGQGRRQQAGGAGGSQHRRGRDRGQRVGVGDW